MPRFLAIDYGSKRIGLAVSDARGVIASPVVTLRANGVMKADVDAVARVADEYAIEAFVVGLPINMDDSEGGQAKLVRRFGEALASHSGKPVHYFDERLSSITAEELLRPAELTRKKRKAVSDAVAAQVILQGFLESQRTG